MLNTTDSELDEHHNVIATLPVSAYPRAQHGGGSSTYMTGDAYNAGISHSIVGGHGNSNFMFAGNTVLPGGTFTLISAKPTALERLEKAASPSAFHNSGERRDPPKCHANTRVAVLDKIMNWILGLDPETQHFVIMWLHGPAGAGKSAIAQTMAERLLELKILLASYFFSRFDPTRNHPRSLISTIAYQIASYFPEVRERVSTIIDLDPLLFTKSLEAQMTLLIVEPLEPLVRSGYFADKQSRRVVIIDGLDECADRDGQVNILQVISSAFQRHHLPFLFLVASRPEHDITHAFGSDNLKDNSTRLALDEDYKSYSDIRLFLSDQFRAIKQTHPFRGQIPFEWPTEQVLSQLVEKSSGQFIYASTVIKFVKSIRHRPNDRLEIILGLRPPTHDLPFSELDALYLHIFSSVENPKQALQILTLQILFKGFVADPMAVDEIETILSLNTGDVSLILCDLNSMVHFRHGYYLEFYHASVEDFLLDRSRSGEFYIDAAVEHSKLALSLFHYFQRDDMHHYFDLKILAYSIERALPNDNLQECILNFNFTQLFGPSFPTNLIWTIPDYLSAIRNSRFVNAENLYCYSFQVCRQHIGKQVENSYATPSSSAFLMSVVHGLDRVVTTDECLPAEDGLRLVDTVSAPQGPKRGQGAPYLDLIKDLCKIRVGSRPCISKEKFANAAIYVLRRFHDENHRKSQINLKAIALFKKYRRNSPWKWRLTMDWKIDDHVYGGLRSLKLAMKGREQRRRRKQTQDSYRKWCHQLRLLHPFMELYDLDLAFLVTNAGNSEKLIKYLRQLDFGLEWVVVNTIMIKSKTDRLASKWLHRTTSSANKKLATTYLLKYSSSSSRRLIANQSSQTAPISALAASKNFSMS